MENQFNYDVAFSRNLGWLSVRDQRLLSQVRVGIVGLGGVGGQYAEMLARLGIQNFVLADFDTFSIENTNRQNECKLSNYEKNKAAVMAQVVRDINPQAQVVVWEEGLNRENMDSFCSSIDIYLDGLDFFEINLRCLVFRRMRQLGKVCITAAPVGTGTSIIVFDKDSMSFQSHFGIRIQDPEPVKYAKFLVGLAADNHLAYMRDRSRVDLKAKKASSLPMGVYSCATTLGSTILKIVTKRGKILKSPWVFHYDPYLMKSWRNYLWLGCDNPLQRLKLYFVRRKLSL